MNYYEAYLSGNETETWEQLCAFNDVRQAHSFGFALAVAREAMRRVRHNIELLIPRWENAGHRFGYAWAGEWAADHVKSAAPLLARPGHVPVAFLDRFEEARGPLPIALRAFYEIVGAVNFVGDVARGWPDQEILDPLQVEDFVPQLPRLMQNETNLVAICPDSLLKYFIGGVGKVSVRVPSAAFDPVMVFEGGDLEMDGRPLTFCRYLRHVILNRGGIGLVAGYNDDAPNPSLVASLTFGLQPF